MLPVILICILFGLKATALTKYGVYLDISLAIITIPIIVSLLISFAVYDLSGFYNLKWLDGAITVPDGTIVNINAGFDETSILLRTKYKRNKLTVFDFYDPTKHTEISIQRARKLYLPFEGTQRISTASIPLPDRSVNTIFLIFAAHEIRAENERTIFFKELNRVLQQDGEIIITEHLRDSANLLAYNIGAFHFLPKKAWLTNFSQANLRLISTIKTTPFITTFILERNGDAS